MKLSDYRDTYYEFSRTASSIARTLAFAGIALIWIFRIELKPIARIPSELLAPLALLATTLAFDLLQYISGTCVWGIFQWYHEKKLVDVLMDPDLDSSSWLKIPQFIFFVLKLFTVLLAYFFLTTYIWDIWFKTKT